MLIKINNVLGESEIAAVQKLMAEASWQAGAHSAGAHAAAVKSNTEMEQNSDQWRKINEIVVNRLYQHPQFQSAVLPSRVSSAFVSRYPTGAAYGPHIDDPVMGQHGGRYRADVAVTVFLNDVKDYEGGELTVHTRFGPTTVKLDAGSAVAYPASSLHEVQVVTAGERQVCVLWAQSLIRDAQQREILADLDDARRALQLATPEASVTTSVDQAYMNLVRLWAEC